MANGRSTLSVAGLHGRRELGCSSVAPNIASISESISAKTALRCYGTPCENCNLPGRRRKSTWTGSKSRKPVSLRRTATSKARGSDARTCSGLGLRWWHLNSSLREQCTYKKSCSCYAMILKTGLRRDTATPKARPAVARTANGVVERNC